MELITPDLGLIIWTSIVFVLLLLLLAKFAWKPMLKAVNDREAKISESLELAEKTKAEMKAMQSQNENLLKEARAERDAIVRDAKEVATKMVEDSKNAAKIEAEKVMVSAREAINSEKTAAISELKNQVASFSLEIAEKLVRQDLSSNDNQKALAEKLAAEVKMN
ncbi:MAG: F0F1 ATP synthase subunit B [Crocinitomicaceae bacterium]|jgi:F-type H+-transporting ATPase subunit b|nr:F0F1 ATP synthase subunit B [Crocinitomicaceae bacterium]MDG2464293.1 F0F1 ATP synthase subunit B [Crocinitomicaceae bacterium]